MNLLREFLNINTSIKNELILEKLDNLKSLRLGKLRSALKQTRSDVGASSINKKISMYSTKISAESSVVDLGLIKSFAQIRKMYRDNPSLAGFSLSTGDAAHSFCLVFAEDDDISKTTRKIGLAYDLEILGLSDDELSGVIKVIKGFDGDGVHTGAESKIERDSDKASRGKAQLKSSVSDWEKDEMAKNTNKNYSGVKYYDSKEDFEAAVKKFGFFLKGDSAYEDKDYYYPIGGPSGNKTKQNKYYLNKSATRNKSIDTVYGELKSYEGRTSTVAEAKKLIDALIDSGVKVFVKGITANVGAEKSAERKNNRPVKPLSPEEAAKSLKTRLNAYKNSKLETAEDISAVLKAFYVDKTKINFSGATYILRTGSSVTNAGDLLKGKKIDLRFVQDEAASPKGYWQLPALEISVKLIDGKITPVEVHYTDADGKKQSQVTA